MRKLHLFLFVAIAAFIMVSKAFAENNDLILSNDGLTLESVKKLLPQREKIIKSVNVNAIKNTNVLQQGEENIDITWLPNDDVAASTGIFNGTGTAAMAPLMAFNKNALQHFKGIYNIKTINDVQFSINGEAIPKITALVVYILTAENGSNNLGFKVQQEIDITSLVDGWNTVTLATPFPITNAIDAIYIGYAIIYDVTSQPFNVGTPAVDNQNLFLIDQGDGWEGIYTTSDDLGLNIRWLIKAGVTADKSDHQNNAHFTNLLFPVFIKQNGTFTFICQLQNRGNQPITSLELTYKLGDEEPQTLTASNLNFIPGSTININSPNITLPSNFTAENTYPVEITITKVNEVEDDDLTDNTQTTSFFVPPFWPTKRVLAEEATGTWCGWCTRGIYNMEKLKHEQPDKWIGVAVHNGDPMAITEYDNALSQIRATFGGSGYPGGTIDRLSEVDPGDFGAYFDVLKEEFGYAELSVTNYTYDTDTRAMSFDANAKFATSSSANDLRFLVIFTEDGVTGTTSGYAQANYYAGGGNGTMGGFENKPGTIPASEMVYNDVARATLHTPFGAAGSLPTNININSEHKYSFTYNVPSTFDYDKLNVILVLLDNTNGIILNAVKSDKEITSIKEYSLINSIFPNPVKNNLSVELKEDAKVTIWDIKGNKLYEGEHLEGIFNIKLDAITGSYILKTENKNGSHTTKFIVE